MASKLYDVYTTYTADCFCQVEAESAREAEKKIQRFYENLDEGLPGEMTFRLKIDAYEADEKEEL